MGVNKTSSCRKVKITGRITGEAGRLWMNSLSELKSIRFNPTPFVLLEMAQCRKQWASLSLLHKLGGDGEYLILCFIHLIKMILTE